MQLNLVLQAQILGSGASYPQLHISRQAGLRREGADSAGASFPLLHSRLRAWFPPAAPCALHTHRSRVTFSHPLYFVSTTVHKLRHTLQPGV